MKKYINNIRELIEKSPNGKFKVQILLDQNIVSHCGTSINECLDFLKEAKNTTGMKFHKYPDVIHWNGCVTLSACTDKLSTVSIETGATEITIIAPTSSDLVVLLELTSNCKPLNKTDEYVILSASYAAKCIRSSVILKREGELNKKIFIRDFLTSDKK